MSIEMLCKGTTRSTASKMPRSPLSPSRAVTSNNLSRCEPVKSYMLCIPRCSNFSSHPALRAQQAMGNSGKCTCCQGGGQVRRGGERFHRGIDGEGPSCGRMQITPFQSGMVTSIMSQEGAGDLL